MVANPARGQLKGKINISQSAFAPENLVSRDGFGNPVPRQLAHLNTSAESGVYLLRDGRFLSSSAAAAIYLFKSLRTFVCVSVWRFLCFRRLRVAHKQKTSTSIHPYSVYS